MRLFLFLSLIPFIFAADKNKPHILTTFIASCSKWDKTANLHIDRQFLIGINTKTQRIEYNFGRAFCFKEHFGKTTFFNPSDPEALKRKDITWSLVLAVTYRKNDMTEVENDRIFYGYDAKMMHNDITNCQADAPLKNTDNPYDEHPFRFNEIKIQFNQIQEPLIHLKTDCGNNNPRGWIAQPGIYKLVTEGNEFYWDNIYYWPRIGQIFT